MQLKNYQNLFLLKIKKFHQSKRLIIKVTVKVICNKYPNSCKLYLIKYMIKINQIKSKSNYKLRSMNMKRNIAKGNNNFNNKTSIDYK